MGNVGVITDSSVCFDRCQRIEEYKLKEEKELITAVQMTGFHTFLLMFTDYYSK